MTGLETGDNTHGFLLAGEGNHLRYLGRLMSIFPVLPAEILGKLEKGGLGLGSHENKLFGLRINIFGCGGIDRDQLVESEERGSC